MGKQNLQARKVYYRCFYIEKEAVSMKYVVAAENAILINFWCTQAGDVALLIGLAFLLIWKAFFVRRFNTA